MIKMVDLKKHKGKIRIKKKKIKTPPNENSLNESMMACLTTKKYIFNVITLMSVYERGVLFL